MDFIEYSSKAIATCNQSLNWDDRVMNATLGLSGEVGEIADHIKKHKFHGHELKIDHLVKEIGDVLWYLNLMADCLGYDLETIAELNIQKLYKRYKDGNFSTEQSLNRVDHVKEYNQRDYSERDE